MWTWPALRRAALVSQRFNDRFAAAVLTAAFFRRFLAELGAGDELIDFRGALEYLRCDAGGRERFRDLEHFGNPAIRFRRHLGILVVSPVEKVGTGLPQLLFEKLVH